MHNLSKHQAQQFKSAVIRSKSCDKLLASDFIKLKKPLFQDYLLHVKRYAGTPPLHKKATEQVEMPELANTIIRSNSSHYYCETNQLLSLKQFVILMEQSRKRTFREDKTKQRESERRLRQSVSRNMQQNNQVDLRLTTSYVKKVIKNQRKSIF